MNSLNAHNFPIFQPIVMKLVSKFMVHRALSDKIYLSLGLLSPSIKLHFLTPNDHISGIFAYDSLVIYLFQLTTTVGSIMEGFDKLCSADPDTLMTVPPTSTFSFDGFMTLLCDINVTVLMEESNSYSGQKTIMDAVSIA